MRATESTSGVTVCLLLLNQQHSRAGATFFQLLLYFPSTLPQPYLCPRCGCCCLLCLYYLRPRGATHNTREIIISYQCKSLPTLSICVFKRMHIERVQYKWALFDPSLFDSSSINNTQKNVVTTVRNTPRNNFVRVEVMRIVR